MGQGIKTNAGRLLESAGVSFETLTYDLRDAEFSAGAVADALDLPASVVFKTLAAASPEQTCLAVVPGDRDLDLKALARAAGLRRIDLLPTAELFRKTGYRRGSVTAIGTRRPLPVYLDESALAHERIAVSAGAPGAQLLLAPADYTRITDATVASIAK